jgi:hypothetical protein
MSRKWSDGMTTSQLIFVAFLIILLGIGVVALQAWLLGIVLSWFGVALSFWQNVLIVLLIGMLFGSSRSSSN